jgi:hypothetical protein
VFVRAVPWDERRAANARRIARAVRGRVVWDVTHNGYDTFLSALEYAAGAPAIHLEDDVALTSSWREKVEAVVCEHSNEVIQFFSRHGDDADKGPRRMPASTFWWSTCFYVPARFSRSLASFGRGWDSEGYALAHDTRGTRPMFDVMVHAFLAQTRETYWLHVPSLVQHLDWESVVNPRRSRKRQSETFVP